MTFARDYWLVWGTLLVVFYSLHAWSPPPTPEAIRFAQPIAFTPPHVAHSVAPLAVADDPVAVSVVTPIVVALADSTVFLEVRHSVPIVAAIDDPLADPVVPVVVALADPQAPMSLSETPDECFRTDACIDQYLWSVYQRAPKLDTIKVPEKIKVIVKKKKGKSRTVTKTVIKLVDEDFTWKDPNAAQKAGMPLMEYVIGGMDRSFRLKLYRVLRAMDDADLAPGITSAFRDDYRQSIADGNKAATGSSYHGGSRRGGYGHGLAADLVSVKGNTRSERWSSSESLWKWIDAHGAEFGIGRPYLDRDPPHVGPIDGKEYADHRGVTVRRAGLETKKRRRLAVKSGPAKRV